MVNIVLNDKENGYEAIGEYVRRFWKHNNFYQEVIVSIGTSYDGKNFDLMKEVVTPYNFRECEFENDWWEGEKYIKLFGIKAVQDLDIDGGIYEE